MLLCCQKHPEILEIIESGSKIRIRIPENFLITDSGLAHRTDYEANHEAKATALLQHFCFQAVSVDYFWNFRLEFPVKLSCFWMGITEILVCLILKY